MFEAILSGLNEQQRPAVEAVRGPVCILAGAGSGKTTTITRRIAYQVASGAFSPSQILAVTFTDKAAKEMAARLQVLGVSSVRARTFHSEARAQYHEFTGENSEVLASKVPVLKSLVQSLPMPHRFTAVRDIATEIEWAKNQMITPEQYESRLGDHRPPIPFHLMASVFSSYEKRKERARMIDFEDLLQRALEVLSTNQAAAERLRNRYLAFTVDEYQDVNLLQQTLLNAWVGDRRDLCVVGDDYQSIYGFTGATARYLLDFPKKYPEAQTIQLTLNYRSTPSILKASNSLVPRLGGSSKSLRHTRADGEPPVFREFLTGEDEIGWIVKRTRELGASGVPWEEIAILYRINSRSEAFEEAFSRGGIPYQVADSPFLRRPGPRSVIQMLRRSSRSDVAAAVEETVRALGYEDEGGDAEGEEATRQADLARLVLMAQEFPARGTVADFIQDLVARFKEEEDGRGIQLLTYHRAKGKEYEAVFLPRLEEGELPFALASSDTQIAEERRLLYVGMTRAKRFLSITWARSREGEKRSRPKPSQFLTEMRRSSPASTHTVVSTTHHPLYKTLVNWRNGLRRERARSLPDDKVLAAISQRRPKSIGELLSVPGVDGAMSALYGLDLLELVKGATTDVPLVEALKSWRTQTARDRQVPAYVIFQDSTLVSIAQERPTTMQELLNIKGVGPAKVADYGGAILDLVGRDDRDVGEKFPNAYQPWTEHEELQLKNHFGAGRKIDEIAELLGRQPGGIRSRLKKLGLAD